MVKVMKMSANGGTLDMTEILFLLLSSARVRVSVGVGMGVGFCGCACVCVCVCVRAHVHVCACFRVKGDWEVGLVMMVNPLPRNWFQLFS